MMERWRKEVATHVLILAQHFSAELCFLIVHCALIISTALLYIALQLHGIDLYFFALITGTAQPRGGITMRICCVLNFSPTVLISNCSGLVCTAWGRFRLGEGGQPCCAQFFGEPICKCFLLILMQKILILIVNNDNTTSSQKFVYT